MARWSDGPIELGGLFVPWLFLEGRRLPSFVQDGAYSPPQVGKGEGLFHHGDTWIQFVQIGKTRHVNGDDCRTSLADTTHELVSSHPRHYNIR